MKPKLYPETRGNGTAKTLEHQRAQKIYEKQARDARKGFEEAVAKKKREYVPKYLQPSQIEAIEKLVAAHGGRRKAEAWLEHHPRAKLAKDARAWAQGALRDMRNPAQSHKSIGFGVAIDFIENYGRMQYPAAVQADTVPVNVVERRQETAIEKPAQPQGIDFVALFTMLDDRDAKREERSRREAAENQQLLIQSLVSLLPLGQPTPHRSLEASSTVSSPEPLPEPIKEEVPAQVEIPATVETLRPVPARVLVNHPRLARQPHPNDVEDGQLFNVLRNMIDVYGEITRQFDEGYLLVYDEINRTFDPELKKKKHGERIQYIGSQGTKYKRQALEAAFRVLVKPFMKAA